MRSIFLCHFEVNGGFFIIFALLGYGLLKGVSFQRLEAGMIEGAHTGVGAV